MTSLLSSPRVRVAVALIIAAGLAGCGEEEKPAAPQPEPPKAALAPPPKAEIKAPPPVAAAPAPALAPAPAPALAPAPAPALAPAPAPAPAPAKPAVDKGGWILLGQQKADFSQDYDRFPVGGKKGKFREIQIRVAGAPIYLESVVVTFGNKEEFKPTVRYQFNERSGSRAIDLPGKERNIRYIDLVYSTASREKGKATVRIYGR